MIVNRHIANLSEQVKPVKPIVNGTFFESMMGARMIKWKNKYRATAHLNSSIKGATRTEFIDGKFKILDKNYGMLASIDMSNIMKRIAGSYTDRPQNLRYEHFTEGGIPQLIGVTYVFDKGMLGIYFTGDRKVAISYIGAKDGQSIWYGSGTSTQYSSGVVAATPSEIIFMNVGGPMSFKIEDSVLNYPVLNYPNMTWEDRNAGFKYQNIRIKDTVTVNGKDYSRTFGITDAMSGKAVVFRSEEISKA